MSLKVTNIKFIRSQVPSLHPQQSFDNCLILVGIVDFARSFSFTSTGI